MTNLYVTGDTVINELVYCGKSASNYGEIINGFSDPNIIHKIFGNSEIVNKYTIQTASTNGTGVITLTKLADLKTSQQFNQTNGQAQSYSDIPENAKNYRLLITLTDVEGNSYYALKQQGTAEGFNPSAVETTGLIFHSLKSDGSINTNDPHYYSGTGGERLDVSVISGLTDNQLTQAVINGTAAGITKYHEGDITTELYTFSSKLAENNVLKTIFTKVSNNGISHEIATEFYHSKEGSAYTGGETDNPKINVGSDQVYFRVLLKKKKTDQVVAYSIFKAEDYVTKVNADGKTTVEIPANTGYIMVDENGNDKVKTHGSGENPATYYIVQYDPTVYDIDVRLYHSSNNPTNLHTISASDDSIPGFDFWDNTYTETKDANDAVTKSKTTLRLYDEYTKKYQVLIETPVAIASADGITLEVQAVHENTGTDIYTSSEALNNIGANNMEPIVIQDETKKPAEYHWDTSGNKPGKVSGNEKFIVSLAQNGKAIAEGYPVKINGEYYVVSYEKKQQKEYDNNAKTTTITDYVVLTKYSGESALTPGQILGDAVEYGIVADHYIQRGHTETNFAVNTYTTGTSDNIDIDGSGTNPIPFCVGNIEQQLWLSAGNQVNIDVYAGQNSSSVVHGHEGYKNYKIWDTTGNDVTVNVIPQPESAISGYVNSLVAAGRTNSAAMSRKKTIKPAGYLTGNVLIDTRLFPEGKTIYVDCTDVRDIIAAGGWHIQKLPGQSIVFNIPGTGNVNIGEFYVEVYDPDNPDTLKDLTNDHGKPENPVQSTTNALNGDKCKNQAVDDVILEHITFNAYEATGTVHLQNSSALFLAPNAAQVTQENGAGWILTGGTVNSGAEWHFYRHTRSYNGTLTGFGAKKFIKIGENKTAPAAGKSFAFVMETLNIDTGAWSTDASSTVSNNGSDITFPEISFPNPTDEGDHYFLIYEQIPESNPKDGMKYDTVRYVVKSTVKVSADLQSSTVENTYYKLPDGAPAKENLKKKYSATVHKTNSEHNGLLSETEQKERWQVDEQYLTEPLAGGISDVEFVNEYSSSSRIDFKVNKVFTNGSLKDHQFNFRLTQVKSPTDPTQATKDVKLSAPVLANTSANNTDNHETVSLGNSIEFTNLDDGKTFYFLLEEVLPAGTENHICDGIRYDENSRKLITVTVSDNGQGVLTVTKNPGRASGVDYDAEFINEQLGSLSVRKIVTDTQNLSTDQTPFTVVVTAPAGADFSNVTAKDNTDANVTLTKTPQSGENCATATFTITKDKTVTLSNLKLGRYTVQESLPNGVSYSATYAATNSTATNVTADNDTNHNAVAVLSTNAKSAGITITNTYTQQTGSLKFVKAVQVNGAAVGASDTAGKALVAGAYVFTVASINLTPAVSKTITVNFDNTGAAVSAVSSVSGDTSVSLVNGEVTVTGLKAGSYTITETQPTNGTSLISATVSSGTGNSVNSETKVVTVGVEAGNTATVPMATFTNNIDTGNLSLTKSVSGVTDNSTAFTFEIALTAPAGVTLANSYPATHTGDSTIQSVTVTKDTTNNTTKITGISLKNSDMLTISGLPAGTEYTITETNPPAGYTLNTSGSTNLSGTIPARASNGTVQTAAATAENTYAANGDVIFQAEKTFTNGNLGSKSFSFRLTQVTGVGNTVQMTTKLAQADEKTTAKGGSGSTRTVTFDVISFTQEDIGKTYYFMIEEIGLPNGVSETNPVGAEDHIRYDLSKHYFTVSVAQGANGLVITKSANTSGDEGTIAKFTNEQRGRLVITKSFSGTAAGDLDDTQKGQILFSVTGPAGFAAVTNKTLTDTTAPAFVKDSSSGVYTLTLDNVPLGTYTVTESNDTIGNYAHTRTIAVTGGSSTTEASTSLTLDAANTEKTAAITNTYDKYQMEITKTFSGENIPDADKNKITFTITGGDLKGETSRTWAQIDAMANDKWILTTAMNNIQPGVVYTVTESNADVGGYTRTTTIAATPGTTTTPAGTQPNTTIQLSESNKTGTIHFTNSYVEQTGSLKFRKTVQVNGAAINASDTAGKALVAGNYIFTIASANLTPAVSKTITVRFDSTGAAVSAVSSVSGDTSVTLSNGEVTVTGLKAGSYTITETPATNGTSLLSTTVTPTTGGDVDETTKVATVTVTAGDTATVPTATFINNIDTGNLSLTKSVSGITDNNTAFTFDIALTAPAGVTLANSYSATHSGNTSIQSVVVTKDTTNNTTKITGISLKSGETLTISGLPAGTGYTITETNPPAGYTLNTSGSTNLSGTIPARAANGTVQTAAATAENTYAANDSVVFSAEKTFTNGNLGSKSFSFRLTQVTGVGNTVQMTTKLAQADEKTTAKAGSGSTRTVTFNAIPFTQEDIGKTYYFMIEEIRLPDGVDATNPVGTLDHVRYDLSKHYFTVQVEKGTNGLVITKSANTSGDGETSAKFTNEQRGRLVITKTFSGTAAGDLDDTQKGQILFSVTGPAGFTPVTNKTLTDTTAPAFVKDSNGVYTLTLDNVPLGTYTVTESNDTIGNYAHTRTIAVSGGSSTTEASTSLTLDAANTEKTAAITNTYDKYQLEITKTFSGENIPDADKNKITFTITGGNLKGETSRTWAQIDAMTDDKWILTTAMNNIQPGVVYTVTESNADVGGYTRTTTIAATPGTTTTPAGTQPNTTIQLSESNRTGTIHFTNKYEEEKASLTIQKELVGGDTGTFVFTVTKGGKWYKQNGEESSTEVQLTLEWSDTNRSLTVQNLNAGTYTVTEVTSGNEYLVEASNSGTSYTATPTTTGTLETGTNTTVWFRNTRKGSLAIEKKVAVNGTDIGTGTPAAEQNLADGTYEFEIQGPDSTTVAKTVKITFVNGKASFAQIDSESATVSAENGKVTVSGLVPGSYTILEKTPANGAKLLEASVSAGSGNSVNSTTKAVTVKVEAGNTANVPTATFRNNMMAASIPLKAEKHITGREFRNGDAWTFTVTAAAGTPMPANPSVTIRPENGTAAVADFGTIAYGPADAGKTYVYTITETGEAAGVVNDKNNPKTVTVKVTADGNGKLTAAEENGKAAVNVSFTNTYTASGSTDLKALKTLTGRTFRNGDQWTFTVTADPATAPMPERAVVRVTPEAGKTSFEVDFGSIAYTLEDVGKTYVYTITETGSGEGVVNDSPKTVTVRISDNGDGTLKAENSSVTKAVSFINKYSAEGETTLKGTKVLSGREFRAGDEWTFTVTADSADAPMPERTTLTAKPVSGNSTVLDFGKIRYTLADLKGASSRNIAYTITETGNVGHVRNDTAKTVRVTLKDSGRGKLDVSIDTAENPLVFTNTYDQGSLTVEKHVVNGTDPDREFAFTVTLSDNGITGTYGEMKFVRGVAKFTLKDGEKKTATGLPALISYQAEEEAAAGYTTQAVNAQSVIDKDGTKTAIFTNTYSAAGRIQLKAEKVMIGRELKAEEFSFELKNAAGKTLQIKKNAADGSILFDEIQYTEADIAASPILYTISEVKGTDGNVTYDEHAVTVKVTLTDNGDGTITAAADEAGRQATFINTCSAKGEIVLTAQKILTGRELKEEEFSFELKDADGNVLQTRKNAANGTVVFDPISYTSEDAAKSPVVYTISEVPGSDRTVLYDRNVEKITVTLKDNGDGTVTAEADRTGAAVAFTNHVIRVRKQDIASGDEVSGCEIRILDEDGKTVDEWTSEEGKLHEVLNLETGKTYILHEKTAPDGYTVTADATFTVDEAGQITGTAMVDSDGVLLVKDAKTRIRVLKTDIATGEELEGSHIQILDRDGNVADEWISTLEAHETEGLKTGEEYILRETVAPLGYNLTTDTKFTIDETGKVTSTGTIREDGVMLVEDALATTEAAVRKIWKDGENRDGKRPAVLTVKLLANGEVLATRQLMAANNWTLIEKNLRKTDRDGRDIVYTWEEVLPEGYTQEEPRTTGALTILTNTYGPEKTEISVRKIWDDDNNSAGKRPAEIRVQLFAEGEAEGNPVILNEGNGWRHTWKDLYRNICEKDGESRPVRYTVEETEVPEGYEPRVTGDAAKGFVITNRMEKGRLVIEKQFEIVEKEEEPEEMQALIDIPVNKIWDDDNNRDGNRPAGVTVRLYAGGEEIDRVTLSEDNGWAHTFTELPKYLQNKTIRYSISEDPVDMYVSEIHGFTVVNKYRPQLTSTVVQKIWDDNDNEFRIRPGSIRMTLSNGTSVLLNEGNHWTAVISNLPAVINGEPVTYTWTEQEVPGYRLVKKENHGNVTVFTNEPVKLAKVPANEVQPKYAGETWVVFEEYDTALGGETIINHVGDCFD
ncbi:MAG: Cna B-type domain-containing protein [Clostridia bacterium]|nr:Cna B-type domain-containing protein [Clostridia bacterium]